MGPDPNRRTWTYRIVGDTGICRIRLDFEDFVLRQPLMADTGNVADGECGGTRGDSFTIASSALQRRMIGFDSFCGTLSGQHIYIHNSYNLNDEVIPDAATIIIKIGSDTFDRRWKIKTSQIECNNPNEPDEGCLQWFTGAAGRIQSFNNLGNNPILIENLLYNICIRVEEGFCGMSVSQTRNNGVTRGSFHLHGEDSTGTTNVAHTDYRCTREYIGIANRKVTTSKFCGEFLGTTNDNNIAGSVSSDVLPLRITVVTNNGARLPDTGFDLIYRQTPCNS